MRNAIHPALPRPPPTDKEIDIFNYDNSFERQFAKFLDNADDVLRFAALGTTEQGASGTAFRVDYLKPNGAIGFYYPDWAVVQQTESGETNWIIETKGRVWEGTVQKDHAMQSWCESVSKTSTVPWKYLRVDQKDFKPEAATLREQVVHCIRKAMLSERDQRLGTMSQAEIRQARHQGRP
ncbi:MAG: hypothetical protein F4135_02015 [Acidimicrobiia bacterium]|nr:hypothetical protein [Acidimicrobiia bacterium]